ncbi:MAG: efflux RND transporter periplasmic adaptor subunit [Alphaproteobacteria bacterium]|nr:efflux RND transporter periplasmic adaptor subunit [Alphaproteobacteria bacterium]
MVSRMGLVNDRFSRSLPFASGAIGALVLMLGMTACQKEEKAAAPNIRPVRTVTVEPSEAGETVSLTGEIKPRYEADIGFRVNGKILERPVDVGTQVKKGDLLARLDPQQYRQDFEVAKAEVAKADAEVTRSQAQEYRQRELLKNGHTTQVAYDQALKTFKTAQAQADAARAKQVQASENLGYTDLRADNDGVISAIGAEPGQVVSAGQMVVRLAQPGEREAVFNLAETTFKSPPKNPTVEVKLVSNPDIQTQGKVRYVSPQADPATRTFTVRISLPDAPPQMRLGANVIGSVTVNQGSSITIPGSALFQKDGKPAVWLVDKDGIVQLKPITVQRYQGDSVVIGDGLSRGDVVVTAGVQKLLPGQKVALMDASAAQ